MQLSKEGAGIPGLTIGTATQAGRGPGPVVSQATVA